MSGIYRSGSIATTAFTPSVDNTYALGASNLRWLSLFVANISTLTSGITMNGGSAQILCSAASQNIKTASDFILGFTASATPTSGTAFDLTLSRNAAGILQIGTSAANALGALAVASITRGAVFASTSTSYTVLSTDTHLSFNAAGTVTLTLGTATLGKELTVRTTAAFTVVSAATNVVPVAGGAAAAPILAATAGKWALLVGDGTNWQIQMSN